MLNKYAVPRQIKPEILKLRGQINLRIFIIFVICEGNGYFRVVSVGQLNFDCHSYCRLSKEKFHETKNDVFCLQRFKVIPLKLFYYQTFFETWRNEHS